MFQSTKTADTPSTFNIGERRINSPSNLPLRRRDQESLPPSSMQQYTNIANTVTNVIRLTLIPSEKMVDVLDTLRRTEESLVVFETRYGMSSEAFLAAFEEGVLPEEEDYYRWRVTYVGMLKLKSRFEIE